MDLLKKGENIKIRYFNGSIRIYHPNLGKIVTLDGSTYIAQEIIFHSPAEHMINGRRFDFEVQIIHNGVTSGDIAKKAILSILFKKKAGFYNKFLDKLDLFNLPNPNEPAHDINENLYIPFLFKNAKDKDVPIMNPFSFYTYQGSISEPPCSERTILYIASKPRYLSSTTIELFKEALKQPDMVDDEGNMIVNNFEPTNFRNIQPLNGRAVFHYDLSKFCGITDLKKHKPKRLGHYEKKITKIKNYFFVNGVKPSGIPGALLVSRKEAKANEKN